MCVIINPILQVNLVYVCDLITISIINFLILKQTFHYNSALWTNKEPYNLAGGETGFDSEETKLPTYWNTAFSKICLGMRIPGEDFARFIAINRSADSLHSLIADDQYRPTSLGCETWKSLLGTQGSLQYNCNREGFNVSPVSSYKSFSKARIGIIGNNENDCAQPDSRIGFGTGGVPNYFNTCGDVAKYIADNGPKNIITGYIFVQWDLVSRVHGSCYCYLIPILIVYNKVLLGVQNNIIARQKAPYIIKKNNNNNKNKTKTKTKTNIETNKIKWKTHCKHNGICIKWTPLNSYFIQGIRLLTYHKVCIKLPHNKDGSSRESWTLVGFNFIFTA